MSGDYVYTMYRADKFYGPERQVLSNISLSFLPGAKIGVLGPNGAGKSTLLRIMAGLEEPSSGVAELHPGATVGFLQQEPELDPAKDVRGNVEDGVAEKRDLLDTFNQLSARFAEPMSDDEMAALLEQQGEVQDRIERTSLAGSRSGSCSSRPTVAPGASSATPLEVSSRPAMIRSRVDLPAPLGPRTPILAPGRNDSEMFASTCRSAP